MQVRFVSSIKFDIYLQSFLQERHSKYVGDLQNSSYVLDLPSFNVCFALQGMQTIDNTEIY
jgi:hypothetical protein